MTLWVGTVMFLYIHIMYDRSLLVLWNVI